MHKQLTTFCWAKGLFSSPLLHHEAENYAYPRAYGDKQGLTSEKLPDELGTAISISTRNLAALIVSIRA